MDSLEGGERLDVPLPPVSEHQPFPVPMPPDSPRSTSRSTCPSTATSPTPRKSDGNCVCGRGIITAWAWFDPQFPLHSRITSLAVSLGKLAGPKNP